MAIIHEISDPFEQFGVELALKALTLDDPNARPDDGGDDFVILYRKGGRYYATDGMEGVPAEIRNARPPVNKMAPAGCRLHGQPACPGCRKQHMDEDCDDRFNLLMEELAREAKAEEAAPPVKGCRLHGGF